MPKRTWTDSELADLKRLYGTMPVEELIAEHFPTKSKTSIKWQVERWGLGQTEYWTERDKGLLRTLCSCNVPTSVTAELLNRPKQAVNVMASKLGFLRKTRDEQPSSTASAERSAYNGLDNLTKGTINELKVICRLLENGLSVFAPLMINHKTDLVILDGQSPMRLQVKTGVYDEKTKRYRVPLRSRAVNKGIRTTYDSGDVDFFVITCPGCDAYYIVPYEVGIVTEFANLYPTRIKQQHSGVDYEQFKNRFDLLIASSPRTEDAATSATAAFTDDRPVLDPMKRRAWQDWEDDALRLLLSNGVPYSVVSNCLKRSKNSVILRANRLGLKSEGIESVCAPEATAMREASHQIDSKLLGVMTEHVVANQLIWRGFDVFTPSRANDRADLAILGERIAARIQVKGATYDPEAKGYRAQTSTKSMKTGLRKTYSPEEVDFILVNCGYSPDVYIIPIDEVQDTQSIRLYPERHVQTQRGPDYEGFLNRYDLLASLVQQRK